MSGWIGAWGNAATVTNLTVTGSQVISVNTSTNALRITQTGTGNAIVIEDSTNPDSTPFVVDHGGNVLLGNASSIGGYKMQVISANPLDMVRYVASGGGPTSRFAKSRSATPGTYSIVSNGDSLGILSFSGDDGTTFIEAVRISASVDGAPGANDMPGKLVFSTTADGASTPTARMTIDSAGNIYGTSGSIGMTSGFFYIPSGAAAPSGVPAAVSGRVPMYYDTANNNFYVYNGAWKKVLLA